MKIKRLDIVGFKSFVDKVSLDFREGITGVVGPNGCGKSNIVDAIRWAMGEQNARHLRGRAMEDVIFGGSESRKPHGMAEVCIVFDNSAGLCPPAYKEYSEIMVTRRLFRSGESEYLLNKTPCRLLDITELFMDTGVGARAYSIIEQGKVGMLVSAKPEERRALIEEAAGVTKFKSRKKTALRKMDATRQNLVRLGDIVTEVRRQLGSLKRQAQRAEKFKELRGEAKRIELCLAGNRFQALQLEIAVLAARVRDRSTALEKLDARLEGGELQLEEQQLLLTGIEEELSRNQEQMYHLASEVQRIEGELTLSSRQREHLSSQDTENEQELATLADRSGTLQAEAEQLQAEDDSFAGRLETVQQDVEQYEEGLRHSLAQEQKLTSQLEDYRRELMDILAEASRLANRRDEIIRRLAAEDERRELIGCDAVRVNEQQVQVSTEGEQLAQQLQQVRSQQEQLQDDRANLLEQQVEAKTQLEAAEEVLSDLRHRLERSRSRQESLEEMERNHDGLADGVRVLLADQSRWQRIAADLLRVDPAYETAVEMALGERLQAVPVATLEQGTEALMLLTQQGARATLLLPAENLAPIKFPAGTPLSQLVRPKDGSDQLVATLLAGVYLVDSLEGYFTQSLPPGVLLVTSAGTCLSWRGELAGGAAVASGSGLLRKKRQLEDLVGEVARYEEELGQQQQHCDRVREQLLQLDEEIAVAGSEGHRLELQALDLNKDQQRLQVEEQRLGERLELINFDLEQLEETHKSLLQEQGQLQVGSQKSTDRQRQLEDLSDQLQQRLRDLRSRLEIVREDLTERRVALAALQQQQCGLHDTLNRLAQQRSELSQRQEQLQQRRANSSDEQQRLLQVDERLRVELDLVLSRREEQQLVVRSVRERYEEQRRLLDEQRERLRGVRSEADELRKEVSRLQVEHHELQVDADHICQGMLERYRVDLAEHQVPEATEAELERQQQQLKRLQQQIDGLGEVNLMAIDEYREQEERYDFLIRQRDDLHQSLDDLQKAINQINRTTRKRFKETFDQVNEIFKQVFPRLFRGGKAELRLTDENDLLETGVDIIVEPPGKRLQNVNLLSGGEKALTSVALIFSLFMIKPTPFCVLDEVDAPLDDANIDRFAEMVREMTERSQFIIITHSKRTMNVVDTMYGVTMQEPGVSKLVSVRINELQPVDESAMAAGA